jgi:hypothetical protein
LLDECLKGIIEVADVLVGPFNLQAGPIEGLRRV